jgi:hypothetical protein
MSCVLTAERKSFIVIKKYITFALKSCRERERERHVWKIIIFHQIIIRMMGGTI